MKSPHGRLRAIESADDVFEATGFVMDCILANSSCDSEIGDTASLRPVELVRDDEGEINHVVCAVRPCGVDKGFEGLLCSNDQEHMAERILFPVPA